MNVITIPTVTSSYTEFHKYDLVKIDGKWLCAFYTMEDWDYYNDQIPTPKPTLIDRYGKKQLMYLQPLQLGMGAFKFYPWEEPEETLTFANGKEIVVYEKRTQPEYSNSVDDITIYWFNFDKRTNEFISFWTGSCWRSDAGIYERMLESLKEKYSEVVA
jgi:hypothetical protein